MAWKEKIAQKIAKKIAKKSQKDSISIRFNLHKELRAAEIRFYIYKEFRAAEIRFYFYTNVFGGLDILELEKRVYIENFGGDPTENCDF